MPAARTDPRHPAPATPLLWARGLTWRWPGHDRLLLDGVGLAVRRGELVCVLGDNGAGKTTLLRLVAGILQPLDGAVEIDGHRFRDDRVAFHRRLGLLTAGNAGLYGRLKVRQHLLLWARAAYVPSTAREERIAAAVDAFELGDLVSRRSDRLSMGQRQRLRLAMAFLHRPDVVLLDEPTTSLDQHGIETLDRVIDAHRAGGGAVVWCSPGAPGTHPEHAPTLRLHDGRLQPA